MPEVSSSVEIVGASALIGKRSAVDRDSRWKIAPIAGVAMRPMRPVPHEDGTLVEAAKAAWPEFDQPIVQVRCPAASGPGGSTSVRQTACSSLAVWCRSSSSTAVPPLPRSEPSTSSR